MSQYDFRFECGSDGVAILTLDRPETLNSLTFTIYGQLERLFRDLDDDESVKAVVLTGHGRGFCSGGSVRPPASLSLGQWRHADDSSGQCR